jgi:hypothetical protein
VKDNAVRGFTDVEQTEVGCLPYENLTELTIPDPRSQGALQEAHRERPIYQIPSLSDLAESTAHLTVPLVLQRRLWREKDRPTERR